MALTSLFLEAMVLVGYVSGHSFAPLAANPNPPLAGNLNLVFVVGEDMAFNTPGDIDPATANLTDSGLQRALMMNTFLSQYVMQSQNVANIYALEPMTHLTDGGEPSRCEWTELRAAVFRSEPYHAVVERFREGPVHTTECSSERLLYLGIA